MSRKSRWVTAVLGVVGAGVVVGMVGTVVFRFGWTEPRSIEFARELVQSFGHGWFPHDESFRHFYLDDDGRVGSELHRHCLVQDVNGDGDTEDAVDNDGTCPGPDTGLLDLAWHPRFPNPRDPAFADALKEGALLAAATAITLTVILVAVGLPYAARANRRLKATEATIPPTTPAN